MGKSAKRARPSSSGSEGPPVSKQRKVTLNTDEITISKEDEKLISQDKVNVKVTVANVPLEEQDLGDQIPRSNLRNIIKRKQLDKALFAQSERNTPDTSQNSSWNTSTSTLVIDSNPATPHSAPLIRVFV